MQVLAAILKTFFHSDFPISSVTRLLQHALSFLPWLYLDLRTVTLCSVFTYCCSTCCSPTWCLQYGKSALVYASGKGRTEVVKMLLDKGANIDLQSKVSQSLMACTSDES
jgi:hypothetical protein